MRIILTGGAGFIGSCMAQTLNSNGIEDIIIVDNIASTEKWMNLRNKKYLEYVHKLNVTRQGRIRLFSMMCTMFLVQGIQLLQL